MQICGQEVNIEDLKAKTAELQALMSDPEVLSAIESKVAEMNEKLNDFKPEIPEIPNLQEKLAELNAELSSSEFAAKLKQIKIDFGEAVDNLPEILNKVNSKLNEFLDELPTAEDLAKLTDGTLVGEALAKFSAAVAEAELKIQRKLATQGNPIISANTICREVPNIEVEIKQIDVQEIRTQIINGEPTQTTVTVQKEVKQKVELPPEPVIPKEVPVKSEPKPVQTNATIDTTSSSVKALISSQQSAIQEKRGQLTKRFFPPDGDWQTVKERSQTEFTTAQGNVRKASLAHVWWYQFEVLKVLGESDIEKRNRLYPAAFKLTLEEAQSLVPEGNRTDLYKEIKKLYETSQISIVVKFEDALKNHYRLRNAQGGLASEI